MLFYRAEAIERSGIRRTDITLRTEKRGHSCIAILYNTNHVPQFLSQRLHQISGLPLCGFQCFYFTLLMIKQHILVFQLSDAHGIHSLGIDTLHDFIYLFEIGQCDIVFLGNQK